MFIYFQQSSPPHLNLLLFARRPSTTLTDKRRLRLSAARWPAAAGTLSCQSGSAALICQAAGCD